MTKDEALKMALKALGDIASARSRGFGIDYVEGYVSTTIKQLRQALAEQEQKPVAYMGTDIDGYPNKFRLNPFGGSIALYTKEQL